MTQSSAGSLVHNWSNPESEALSWWHERWHYPDPLTPLAFDYAHMLYHNMIRGMRAKGEAGAIRVEQVDSYVYIAFGPPRPDDPEPLGTETQPDRFENHVMWDELWLPEIQRYIEEWKTFDRGSATLPELLEHLDRAITQLQRCWEIHDRLDFGPGTLFALVGEALGWTAEEASDLVLGVASKSTEGDDALRALARLASDTPAVREIVVSLDDASEALAALPEAAAFRAALDAYLAEFGLRSDNFHDIALTSWIEDPTPVFAMLRLYLRDSIDGTTASHAAAEAKRDAAQERARAEFTERLPDRLDEFERELAYGLRGNQLNEDHNYWLDQMVLYWARMDMLAAGDLLVAAGSIEARDDVFMLSLDEVRTTLLEPIDRRAAVQSAREALEAARAADPPGQIGAPMPDEMKPMLSAVFGQFESTSTAEQVRGLGASAGSATGIARIITSLDDADRLEDGDILVAETTSPPWTPLFGVAGAVVTDAGGPMSHVAIVAREYGIPAVVGTADATKRITDGQRIRVDGSEGTVDLLKG